MTGNRIKLSRSLCSQEVHLLCHYRQTNNLKHLKNAKVHKTLRCIAEFISGSLTECHRLRSTDVNEEISRACLVDTMNSNMVETPGLTNELVLLLPSRVLRTVAACFICRCRMSSV
jgi:hypothetical protein